MRTETLTIVFTDIKGYTAATSAQTHQQNADMLHRIERLVEPVVRAFTGQVIKSIGDAYMIVFSSPTEAVRCALAIQDRIHQYNGEHTKQTPVHIRVAMNIGEVRVHRGDVFGEPVNIASRIETVTPADEIYFSEAIYLTMNRSDIAAERVGEYEFKGIPELVTVYRAKKTVSEDSNALPFGGLQLQHWKRMHWVRRAYSTVWAMAILGLLGAAYLRYRPQTDYSEKVAGAKNAVEQGNPIGAIAFAGQIPDSATQEKASVRRYRRQAVAQLLASGNERVARSEVDALLSEDPRDPEALLLKGFMQSRHPDEMKQAIVNLGTALKIEPQLALRSEVAGAVVEAYNDPSCRRQADGLVENYLKQNATPALQHALSDVNVDRGAKNAIATRLDRLGAGQDVDWVALALEDLKSTSCKTRKAAITRLQTEGDERAVGPLLKLADTKSCVSTQARKAVDSLLGK